MLSAAPNSQHLCHYGCELPQTKPGKNPNRQLEKLRPAALRRHGDGASSLPANYITKTLFNQVSSATSATSATPARPGGFLLCLSSRSGLVEDLGRERMKEEGRVILPRSRMMPGGAFPLGDFLEKTSPLLHSALRMLVSPPS